MTILQFIAKSTEVVDQKVLLPWQRLENEVVIENKTFVLAEYCPRGSIHDRPDEDWYFYEEKR